MPALDVAVNLSPTFDVPSINAMLLLRLALFAPLFESVTAPVKRLLPPLVIKSIALAPALKLDVPDTVIEPVCDIAPVLLIIRLPTVCVIPVIPSVLIFVSAIFPLLIFVALKPEIVFALLSVVPPTELVVSNAPLT